MYAAPRGANRRFSLLLLEDGEDYVCDWVATCAWPPSVPGGEWGGGAPLAGRLRLASKSLFFEADDVRIPVVRLPFAHVQSLAPTGEAGVELVASQCTRMKACMVDAPYSFDRGPNTAWAFQLPYARLDAVLPLAHTYLAASRLPYAERGPALDALAAARVAAAAFDPSRLVDYGERVAYDGEARLVTPLVRQAGRRQRGGGVATHPTALLP